MDDLGYVIGYIIGWCLAAWAMYGVGSLLTRKLLGYPSTRELREDIRHLEHRLDLHMERERLNRGDI